MPSKASKQNKPKRRDPLLGTFATQRLHPLGAISRLKTERTYKEAKQIIRDLRYFNFDAQLYGSRQATDWNKILNRPMFPLSADWIQELGWLAHGFCAWSPYINKFRQQRKRFGTFYLLGRYQAAQSVLDEIFADHGCTFWLAERQFMLHQAAAGFEKHKQHLGELQKRVAEAAASYLITMLSNRLEPHITYDSFNNAVEKELNALRKDGHTFLASLIELQVSPWTFGWKSQSHEMLWWCVGRPLIDRYNLTLKVLSSVAFDAPGEQQKQQLAGILQDLQACLDDPQLTHIQWALLGEVGDPRYDRATQQYLAACDQFVTGSFDECVHSTEALLAEDPTSFDTYWLLARALACLLGRRKLLLDENSISWRIIQTLQDIAENRKDLNIPVAALRALALNLGDNHLGLSLWQFAERESGILSEDACRYALIKSKVHSLESIDDKDSKYKKSCLQHLRALYPDHPSLELFTYRHNIFPDQDYLPPSIASAIANITKAQRAASRGNHQEVLSYLAPILAGGNEDLNQRLFLSGDAAPLEFEALVGLNRQLDAAASVVRHYIANPNILRHVPFERLIEGGNSDALRATIYWPVLVFLTATIQVV